MKTADKIRYLLGIARRMISPPAFPPLRKSAPDTVVTASPHVRVCDHGEGIVLFDIENGELFNCNATGRRIWSGLSRRQSVASIASELSRNYRIPEDECRDHVARFVSQLSGHGLVMTAPGGDEA